MNRIAVLEVFYEYEFVKYYTVRLGDHDALDDLSETDKFYQVYDDKNHPSFAEFDTIMRVIDAMGYRERGAESCLFRFEDAAHALPPPRRDSVRVLAIEVEKDSQLRLYCIRLTNEVVILLNGGVKTKDQALNCPNVAKHFRLAQQVAKGIDDYISNGIIDVEGKEIINNSGEDEIILYL